MASNQQTKKRKINNRTPQNKSQTPVKKRPNYMKHTTSSMAKTRKKHNNTKSLKRAMSMLSLHNNPSPSSGYYAQRPSKNNRSLVKTLKFGGKKRKKKRKTKRKRKRRRKRRTRR